MAFSLQQTLPIYSELWSTNSAKVLLKQINWIYLSPGGEQVFQLLTSETNATEKVLPNNIIQLGLFFIISKEKPENSRNANDYCTNKRIVGLNFEKISPFQWYFSESYQQTA